MIAIYLHDPRPESFDRARALVAALGDSARLVSAHPPPIGWTTDWSMLADSSTGTWSEWLQAHTPSTVVVDGPPEHARVVCDLGASLVMVATPGGGDHGERGSAYADAAAILAPWPQAASGDWPATWRERTIHVGAIGWRAGQVAHQAVAMQPSASGKALWQAVAIWATHAGPAPRERRSIAVETPGWRWTYTPERDLLEPGPVWSSLMRADVAVCAPNAATIAALAAFQVPAVLVLPARPTPAQAFLAQAASRTAPVVVVQPEPRPEEWHTLLNMARSLDGGLWKEWSPEPGLAELAGHLLGAGGTNAGGADLVTV
jgi:chitodextrinase